MDLNCAETEKLQTIFVVKLCAHTLDIVLMRLKCVNVFLLLLYFFALCFGDTIELSDSRRIVINYVAAQLAVLRLCSCSVFLTSYFLKR